MIETKNALEFDVALELDLCQVRLSKFFENSFLNIWLVITLVKTKMINKTASCFLCAG